MKIADIGNQQELVVFWEKLCCSNFVVCKNPRAFRKRSIVICFDYNEDTIENIWLNHSPLREDNKLYKEFLLKTASTYDFLLADWWKSIMVNISNSKDIDRYLSLNKH